MSDFTLFHNPRCSKSRKALELLRERGIEPSIVEYLKSPPTAVQVTELIRKSGATAHEFLRAKEAPYGEQGLSADSTVSEIAKAISEHPVLLERPVLVRGDRAVIARPPERVFELLD
jgi:arsenate reductase (glutaredoxin)